MGRVGIGHDVVTALERIKEIEVLNKKELPPGMSIFKYMAESYKEEIVFLIKAFNLMREIAKNPYRYPDGTWKSVEIKDVDTEFEERMNEKETKA